MDARAVELVNTHIDKRRFEQARAVLVRYLQRSPHDANANNLMAVALLREGRCEQSVNYAQRAVDAVPANAAVLLNLAHCLLASGQVERAISGFKAALAMDPSNPHAASGLTSALLFANRFTEAIDTGRQALAHTPADGPLRLSLAGALLASGRADESVAALREGLTLIPGHPMLLSRLASAMLYAPTNSAREVFEAHRNFARSMAPFVPAAASRPRAPTPQDAQRRLRLGVLSSDLRSHPVARFLLPLLEHIDKESFEVIGYQYQEDEDGVTAQLRSLASGWRKVDNLDDEGLAAAIRSDRVDILIELSGLTSRPCPLTLLLKPAPMIVSWLGYPSSLAFPTIDYRIVDSLTDPAGAESLHTERLIRLDPCFLCYTPPPQAAPPPAPRDTVTFGSFNTIQKVSDPLLVTWGRILSAVPGSRLLLKSVGLQDPALRTQVLSRATAAGIVPGRLDLLGQTTTLADHLATYRQVDIALDTFPYAGTTTTCEALAMGVPVISLKGDSHASRVGLSLLSCVGLPDLCAENPDDYIRLATSLAADSDRRRLLRGHLPTMLARSPLCDAPAFAARFGAALRAAWGEVCNRSPQ